MVDARALMLDLKDNLDLAAVVVDGGGGRSVDAARSPRGGGEGGVHAGSEASQFRLGWPWSRVAMEEAWTLPEVGGVGQRGRKNMVAREFGKKFWHRVIASPFVEPFYDLRKYLF